jgi:hypothetical protein
MSKIKVLIKEPTKDFRVEEIENDLKTFQGIVGGYIECSKFGDGHVIVCDEEGKLKGKRANFCYRGDVFVGTVIICRVGEDEFLDIPEVIDPYEFSAIIDINLNGESAPYGGIGDE